MSATDRRHWTHDLIGWAMIGVALIAVGAVSWIARPPSSVSGWRDCPVKMAGEYRLRVAGDLWDITLAADGTSVSQPRESTGNVRRWVGVWSRDKAGLRVMEHREGSQFAVAWTARLDPEKREWVIVRESDPERGGSNE